MENIFQKKNFFFDGGRRAILSGLAGGRKIFLAVTDAKKKMFPLTCRTHSEKKFFRGGQKGFSDRNRPGSRESDDSLEHGEPISDTFFSRGGEG